MATVVNVSVPGPAQVIEIRVPGPQGAQGIQGVPGPGVAPGGTAGQVLSKVNGTDYNTSWISPLTIGTTATTAAAGDHTHADLTNATDANTSNTLVRRNSTGQATFVNVFVSGGQPTATNSVTRRDFVETGDKLVAPNAQTAAYTFVLADGTRAVEVTSATAVAATIPPNSSVAYPVGTKLELTQMGAGKISFAAGTGVTLRSPGGLLGTSAQYATIYARKRATDEWVLSGSLA